MVAKTIELPNIKKCFIPDPGMTIGDFDLKGADAQVVAWEANDAQLMEFFRKGEGSIHDINMLVTKRSRQETKQGVHLTNYGGKAATCAKATGMTLYEATEFQANWFHAHPGIKEWHDRVWWGLLNNRKVTNILGYERMYFDRIDERLLPQALAWGPQSTVGLIISKALIRVHKTLPWIQPLMQVHDSLVLQWPTSRTAEAIEKVLECMKVVLPYPEPLIISASYKTSTTSWGDC